MNQELVNIKLRIIKPSDCGVASFDEAKNKSTFQIDCILKLLTDSIAANRVIGVDDIRNSHAEWCVKYAQWRSGSGWFIRNGEKVWGRAKTKEEWLESYCSKYRSIPWFRSHIGHAILKGKLLVLPVINIE